MDNNNIFKKCNKAQFNNLLHVYRSSIFTLDLSKATVVECIEKMCDTKKAGHPHMKKIILWLSVN